MSSTGIPRPSAEDLERIAPGTVDVSALNLAAMWSSFRALGHSRLIMSGVMMHLAFDRRWIASAIPDAELTIIRLRAADATLIERLDKREIGSGREEQRARTLRQAKRMAAEETAGLRVVITDGKTPQELAATILNDIGWVRSATG